MTRHTSSRHKLSLKTQRELLRLRSQALREGLALDSARSFRPAFRASDRLADGAHWLRQNRTLVGVALSALAGSLLVRPRLALSLGTRALLAWRLLKRAQPVWRLITRRRR